MTYLQAVFGFALFIGIAYLFSSNRKKINWRLVLRGLLFQIVLGILILKVSFISDFFKLISSYFVKFLSFSNTGAQFVLGDLADGTSSLGVIIAFQVLPIIIFFSAVTALLYYLGILQKIVYVFAWIMNKVMFISGAESLSAAGNVFLGQTEAPLLVRPFIKNMTQSELMCLMTGGMATIAGSVLAAFVSFLAGPDASIEVQQEIATRLITASIMNAPAAIVFAKILLPEQEPEKIQREMKVSKETVGVNFIDALASGASDGLKLALNVGAMLLAFIAVIALLDAILFKIGYWIGINEMVAQSTNQMIKGLSLSYIFGLIGSVIAFAMGVEMNDIFFVGSLVGQKTAINEFIAYQQLGEFKSVLSDKSILISTFALCGFSNFSSIAIQIGGIGGMAPSRQGDLSRLGMRALLAASLACFMSATIAGILM